MKSLLLTVNRRLARTQKTSSTIRTMSWEDFLLELFELNRATTQSFKWRLSPLQEKMLWAKAMEDFPTFGFARQQTIECARDAYALVKAYQLKTAALIGYKEDCDLFAKALERFECLCNELNAFSSSALIEQLLVSSVVTMPYQHLQFYGFDEFTPAQHALITLWEASGVLIEHMPQISRKANTIKVIAQDANDEMRRAALYAKNAHARNETMAIVVPNLQDQWFFVHHQLAEVFNPGYYFPGNDVNNIPYNISSGASLDNQPIIACLLETLKTLDGEVSIETWGNVLHSPFIRGGCSEASQRAAFDMALRDKEALTLSVEVVQAHRLIPTLFSAQCDNIKLIKRTLSKRTMRDWVIWLKSWIDVWGWAQERTLNSAEYQCVDTFNEILPALFTLDALQKSYHVSEFIDALYDVLKSTLFQTETQDKPIQVLGLLEAAGMSFDHVWVVGLTADNNPARAMPHPFIPAQVQVAHDMPHSSPERELRVAKRLLERLVTGAFQAVLSYASHDDKGEPQLESPLIAEYTVQPVCEDTPERMPMIIAQCRDMQAYDDWIGWPLKDRHLKGGSAVLKDQAACPHAGYLKHRLLARSPRPAVLGLSLSQQGTVMHKVLEGIWSTLKSRKALMQLDDERLSDVIEQQISSVLGDNLFVESKRINDIVMAWLAYEKTRPDFIVSDVEKKVEITLGELSLTLKMDRIDAVGENQYLLLDYKTGDAHASDWQLPRMNEPQLPLYAAFMDPKPIGMAFALLKKNKIGLEGVIDDAQWDDMLRRFRDDLLMLAEEVQAGYGANEPKYGAQTCSVCELASGCRKYTGGFYEG